MSSIIEEMCACLPIVLQHIKSDDNISVNEMMEKTMIAFNDVAKSQQLITSMSQINSSFTDGESNFKQLIQLLVKSLIVLSKSEDQLLSINDSLVINSLLAKLTSITFVPYINKYFSKYGHILNESNLKLMKRCSDFYILSRDEMIKLCSIYCKLMTTKSIISNFCIEHCFASLIAAYLVIGHETHETHETHDDSKNVINEEMNKLIESTDGVIVIRNLLLLMRCQPAKWANIEISRLVSQLLICNNGLMNLITAVLDTDESSQKQTTHNQRYQAIGTVVAAVPQLCCPIRQYYSCLAPQLFQLLSSSDAMHPRVAALIVNSLNNRNKKLTDEFITNKILDAIQGKANDIKTIGDALVMIHHLILSRYDLKKFISIVPHLFYIRVKLHETLSHYKILLDTILFESFSSIKQSHYLLDNILFNYHSLLNKYQIDTTDDVIGVKTNNEIENSTELELKQVDDLVQVVLILVRKVGETFKVDFFLLLLERMTFTSPSLLTCSIVDSLHDDVSPVITKYPEKSLRFVATSLQRVASQQIDSIKVEDTEISSDKTLGETQNDSLSMCLQIMKVLINERNKLSEQDVNQLKQCVPHLEIVSRSEFFDETTRKTSTQLKNDIESISMKEIHVEGMNKENVFDMAMQELNDPLMPIRAHALITLKQLIYAKDKRVLENKTLLINAFKMCLSDPESYIYLSAISSLSALAIICTNDVLPILTQSFHDDSRSIQERVNVGEVLIQLSRSIGDLAHYYSPQFIHCFLLGTKSEDATIRISSLSNLGQFCGVLRFALSSYIVELMMCVESLLKTDPNIEVKRASVMFLHLMLNGIDIKVISSIESQLKSIYQILRHVYSTSLDDILLLHTQLAIEQINRIAREMLTPNKELVKNIKILNL